GYIAQEDVPSHRMHHVLTRAVGGPEERLEGDIHAHRLVDGDRVLLCSDGLTDMVQDREIEEILAARPGSHAACEALMTLALEHEGRGSFGAEFVELARSVYRTNDRRALLKRRLNLRLGSDLVEVKSYRGGEPE